MKDLSLILKVIKKKHVMLSWFDIFEFLFQVNHFGSFVRFFFSLPAATDHISARMVLTTLDSAVHWATSSPCGPVHINCPFREPLENSPSKWMTSCLKGLDFWMSSTEPFTKYIKVQSAHTYDDGCGQMSEILNLIRGTNKGILLIGAIHSEDEMWAVLLLVKHLQWPVVADILSGLRLRKLLISFPEIGDDLLFVDHLDHALLSDSVRSWINFDLIIQVCVHDPPLSLSLLLLPQVLNLPL